MILNGIIINLCQILLNKNGYETSFVFKISDILPVEDWMVFFKEKSICSFFSSLNTETKKIEVRRERKEKRELQSIAFIIQRWEGVIFCLLAFVTENSVINYHLTQRNVLRERYDI